MALRSTQIKRPPEQLNKERFNIKASISGSQAHSLLNAKLFGNEERKVPTLPKLKFLENKESDYD